MKLARIFSKQGPPIDRWVYGLASITFLGVIADLTIWNSVDSAGFVYNLILAALFVLTWPILTIRRLIELRLNLLWIVPILAPLGISEWAHRYGLSVLVAVGLVVQLFVLVPLTFLPPRAASTKAPVGAQDTPLS